MTYDALAKANEIMDASGVIGWQTIDFWVGFRNDIAAALTAAYVAGRESMQEEAARLVFNFPAPNPRGGEMATTIRSIPSKEPRP